MSDELPTGSVNLEDDAAPAAPVVPPAAPPVAAAPEPPAVPDAVELEGQQYVPVAALTSERRQRQALQTRADRVDALEQELAQNRPYVEFLKNNPQLTQPRAPEPQTPPQADPQAVEAAQLMDFYKPDGQLDVDKGARYVKWQQNISRAAAGEAVRPVVEASERTRSQANFQRAHQIKDASGASPSKESLTAAFSIMPEADTANPQVAAVLTALAFGMDRMRQVGAPAPPVFEPVAGEASGGQPRARQVLGPMEQKVAAAKGMTHAKWAEQTQGFQPGRSNVLED